ncbi:MAG TPA: hypothetical protein VIM67_11200 [Terriglobus sp.]
MVRVRLAHAAGDFDDLIVTDKGLFTAVQRGDGTFTYPAPHIFES